MTLSNDNKENNQAHKIILTGTKQDIKKKYIGINTEIGSTKTIIEKKNVGTNTDKETNHLISTRTSKSTKDNLSEVPKATKIAEEKQRKEEETKRLRAEEKQRKEEETKRLRESEKLNIEKMFKQF